MTGLEDIKCACQWPLMGLIDGTLMGSLMCGLMGHSILIDGTFDSSLMEYSIPH